MNGLRKQIEELDHNFAIVASIYGGETYWETMGHETYWQCELKSATKELEELQRAFLQADRVLTEKAVDILIKKEFIRPSDKVPILRYSGHSLAGINRWKKEKTNPPKKLNKELKLNRHPERTVSLDTGISTKAQQEKLWKNFAELLDENLYELQTYWLRKELEELDYSGADSSSPDQEGIEEEGLSPPTMIKSHYKSTPTAKIQEQEKKIKQQELLNEKLLKIEEAGVKIRDGTATFDDYKEVCGVFGDIIALQRQEILQKENEKIKIEETNEEWKTQLDKEIAENNELKEELKDLRNVKAELNAAQKLLTEKEDELKHNKVKIEELEAEKVKANYELKIANDREEWYKNEERESRKLFEAEKAKFEHSQRKLEEEKRKVVELERKLKNSEAELEKEVDGAEKAKNERDEEKEIWHQNYKSLENAYQDEVKKVWRIERKIKENDAEKEELKRQLENEREKVNDLNYELNGLQEELRNFNKNRWEEKYQNLKRSLDDKIDQVKNYWQERERSLRKEAEMKSNFYYSSLDKQIEEKRREN